MKRAFNLNPKSDSSTPIKSSEEANNVTNVSTVESQEVSDSMSLCDTTTRSEVNDNQNTIHFTNDCLDVTDCKSSRETTQCLPQKLNKSITKGSCIRCTIQSKN